MTTLVAERVPTPAVAEPPAGVTLERLIAGAWDDLSRCGGAVCPVCCDDMSRASVQGSHGSCSGCGSELS